MEKKRVLSCIQPTGDMHIGNYLGAVGNYVRLQDQYICRYGVVDYHSMTMPYNPTKLREATWSMAFQLLACGVKVENLFIQSLIPEHTELCWILSCFCSYGDVSRMTQFKDKSAQVNETKKESLVSAGLFLYPILQAADILIYRPDYVPVGKDQDQHLELSRTIAERFNATHKKEFFPIPQTLHTETPKILSLADPSRKMSKSLGEKHYINLFGDPKRAEKQVRSAVTDLGDAGDTMSAGVQNLFMLLEKLGSREVHDALMQDYKNKNLQYSTLKQELASVLSSFVGEKKEALNQIVSNKKEIKAQILESSFAIRQEAQETIKAVRAMTGLLNLKIPRSRT